MYNDLLGTPTGRFIDTQVSGPQMVMRMIDLSDLGLPALGALTGALPANLENKFKRLAGHLVKRAMRLHGYALIPGRRRRVYGSSLFKRGSCYQRTIKTASGNWKGMPVGFDFDGNRRGSVTRSFQANWDAWTSREKCLEHFRAKIWVTPADLDALGQLWDEFARK